MSSHFPTTSLDHARRFAQHRAPSHTPAKTPKPAPTQSNRAPIALAVLRAVAPGVAGWYWPRRHLIHNELHKLLGPSRTTAPAPAPQQGPRRLRFREF